jgi:hypothetical protein
MCGRNERLEKMGSFAPLEELNASRSTAGAIDVVTGFIYLAPQGLPFFRRKPSLALSFRLATICAVVVLARLGARVGLSGPLLGLVGARVNIGVGLLRQPVCDASQHQQGKTKSSWLHHHHGFFRNVGRLRFRRKLKCMPDYPIAETGSGKVCNTL